MPGPDDDDPKSQSDSPGVWSLIEDYTPLSLDDGAPVSEPLYGLRAGTPLTFPDWQSEKREDMRGRIASSLIGLVAGVILLTFITIWTTDTELAELKELLIVLIPALMGVVGTVAGFYFGERSNGPGR